MKTFKTERGQEYFTIYNVVANEVETHDKIIVRTFLNEKDAREYIEFARKIYKELYYSFRINETLVWM